MTSQGWEINRQGKGLTKMPVESKKRITESKPIETVMFEHMHGNVLGSGQREPRISWVYRHELYEDKVAGAQIRIRRAKPGEETREEIIGVDYRGNHLHAWPVEPLESRERTSVAVRLVDDKGQASAWSDEVSLETGILEAGDRLGAMVGPGWYESTTDWRHAPLMRKEFELKAKPASARLYLTAYGLVEAEINGRKVGSDILTPGWTSYDDRLLYWTYDVTDYLQNKGNALGLWLGDGWYRGRLGFRGGKVNIYGDRLGAYAQLNVTYADGSEDVIVTNAYDKTWKAHKGPIVSSGLCEGEEYDARLEEQGWSEPGFDDANWEPVAELPLDVDKLTEPIAPAVREIDRHRPVSIQQHGAHAYLIDMGVNCTQRLRFKIHGFNVGQSFTVQHAEVLEDGELATAPLRRGHQIDRYTSNGEDTFWEPRFTIHGFRYALVEGWPSDLEPDDVVAIAYGSDLERTGWLETSDERVNQLHDNIVRSMNSNFVSIPTDCPQRDERLGWTGDIALFAPTAAMLFDVEGFLSSWLHDLNVETDKFGSVPYYVPYFPLGEWQTPKVQALAIWGDSAVLVPWAIYMDSGDKVMLGKQYNLVVKWIEEVSGYLSPDGVWDRRPGIVYGQLGDWLDPTAPPDDMAKALTAKELVATAYFARSARLASKMASDLGLVQYQDKYAELADHVKEGFISRFVGEDGLMTSDTQCAYALAIHFGLLDDHSDLKKFAGRRLAQLVRDRDYTVGTGFAGTPYILPALTETGHLEEAYRLFLSDKCPSWLYQVSMGATTTWERWDSMLPNGKVNSGVGMTSFNHYALGSVAEWMYSTLGGLVMSSPGWHRFKIAPKPWGPIKDAHVVHKTALGTIDLTWKYKADEGKLFIDAAIPEGSSALVEVGEYSDCIHAGMHHLVYEYKS